MYCITMTTYSRPNNGFTHLYETFDNLRKSGMFDTELYKKCEFHLFDSGSKELPDITKLHPSVVIHASDTRITGYQNFIRCVDYYVNNSTKHYMFHMQDDIDVSVKYFDTVHSLVSTYLYKYNVFSYYTPYYEILHNYQLSNRPDHWHYDGRLFYALLSVVFTRNVTSSLLKYFISKYNPGQMHQADDIHLKNWLIENEYDVCACVPNIVQHIGDQSSFGNRPERKCPGFDKSYHRK